MTEPLAQEQTAPYPFELAELVDLVEYRPGWKVWMRHEDRGQGSVGLTLSILVVGLNSYPPHHELRVRHLFPVPPAAYNRSSWQRWLLSCYLLVEQHEACEWFTVAGQKPYAPNHGPGEDPYIIHDLSSELERRTSFRGELNESPPS